MKKLHLILHFTLLFLSHFNIEHSVDNIIKIHDYLETLPADKILSHESIIKIAELLGIKIDDKAVIEFYKKIVFFIYSLVKIF
jgi:hypothetical protein